MTEAIRWTHELQDQGLQVSVGLMQINVETTRVPLSQLFDPCTNIAIGWDRLSMLYTDAADRVGEGQRALRMALSAYNSGGFTSALDYASKVARNAQ
jgi:type IV secretion system protein VirB1